MTEQINILINMQQVDDQIVQVKAELLKMEKAQAGFDSKIQAFKETLNSESSTFEEMKKMYRQSESDVLMNTSMIEKSQEKLRAVKTNKEYQSILKEIDDLKKKNSNIEDSMLEQLEKIEKLETIVKEKNNNLTLLEANIDKEKIEIIKGHDKTKARLEQLGLEKENTGKALEPKNLNLLNAVKQKVKGNVVVPVQSAVCRGCNLNIPPQLFNELQRLDSLKICPNCQRIIYWKESE